MPNDDNTDDGLTSWIVLSIEELNLSRTNVTEDVLAMIHSSRMRRSLTRILLSGNKHVVNLHALIILKGAIGLISSNTSLLVLQY